MNSCTSTNLKLNKLAIMLGIKLFIIVLNLSCSTSFYYKVNVGIFELQHSFSMSVSAGKGE